MKKENLSVKFGTIDHLIEYKKDIKLLIYESLLSSFSEVGLKDYKINEIYISLLNYVETEKAKVYLAYTRYPVGFIWFFQIKPKRLHINYFAINPNNQRQGIGKKLLYELQKYAICIGVEVIELYVTKSNQKAIRFYQNHGYKYEQDLQNNRIVMVKELIKIE